MTLNRQLFQQWRNVFQILQLKVVFFHLVHNVHKQLKQTGLQGLYNSNPDFVLSAKMTTTLCFVPVLHMDIYIDALPDDLPLELHSLLN